MAKLSRRLILFDIDGTLLRCGPQVRPLFLDALKRVFGGYGEPDGGVSFAGKTDPWITLELARGTGLDDREILPRLPEVRRLYVANLERGLRREGMCLLPGVVELLEGLTARDDVVIGLLTGNWQQGAWVKLSRFDLGRFFSFGAFGDDAIERRDLVPVALERARVASGRRFEPEQTLIIGDTAFDVDCARAAGVPSLAVTTGFATAERLEDAGADWVFPNLVEATREIELFCG